MNQSAINNTTEAAIKIARTVIKDATATDEVRRSGRTFLTLNKAKRTEQAELFLATMRAVYHMDQDAPIARSTEATPASELPTQAETTTAPAPEVKTIEAAATAEPPAKHIEPSVPNGNPTASISVASIKKALEHDDGRHLGDLVGWSINGSRPKAVVESLAAAHDILQSLALPAVTANSCYRKAISQVFKEGRGGAKGRWQAVLVEDSADKIVHSIVTTSLVDDDDASVSAKDATFETEIKIGFNKEAYRDGASAEGCLVAEDFSHPAAVLFKSVYLEMADIYLASDIRNAFQNAFRIWDACPVLPHGGLWYIPAVHAEKVRAWNNFMIDLGMATVVIPTFDTAETIASLQAATRDGLEAQLNEILRALDHSAEKGLDKTRTSTMETRLEEFDELRRRAELYSAILGTTINDLTEKVKVAAGRVMTDLTARRTQEAEVAHAALNEKLAARNAARIAKRGSMENYETSIPSSGNATR